MQSGASSRTEYDEIGMSLTGDAKNFVIKRLRAHGDEHF